MRAGVDTKVQRGIVSAPANPGVYVMAQHVAMASNDPLVIPANVRSELGMQDGGKFIVHVEDGQIRLEPFQAAVARAQAIGSVEKLGVPATVSPLKLKPSLAPR